MLRIGYNSKRLMGSRGLLAQSFNRGMCSQSQRLEGKVAIITGAASGIGKATAAKFISNGAKVVIADINESLGRATAKELGPNATFVHCDVADESNVAAIVDSTVARHGRIDIMHCNAGISCGTAAKPGGADVSKLDMSDFDRVMRINVRGAVNGVKHAARVMGPARSGSILLTASVAGPGLAGLAPLAYSVSKCAVAGVVRSAAASLAGLGIRVNGVAPFAVPTEFVMGDMRAMFPWAAKEENGEARVAEALYGAGSLHGARCEPDDVANAALYLVSDEAKYVSGHILVVDGGFTCFKTLNLATPNRDM